jgi:hypothetical protein
MYLLPCSCGQSIPVGRAQAGQQVTCACGKELTVPTLRGLRELQPAPPEKARSSPRAWTPLHGVLFASGIVAAVVGVIVAIHNVRLYAVVQNYTDDQSQDVIEHEASHIDIATPEQLLVLWNQERTHGLGTKGTPLWIAAQQSAKIYWTRVTIAGIVAAAGAGLAIGAVFIGRSGRAG